MVRNSVFFFAALAIFAIAGFWPSYFARVSEEKNFHVHLHGAAMSLWVLLLISQAFLIRSGTRQLRQLHRLAGKISYVLVPVIIFSTLSLSHFRVQESGTDLRPDLLYFLYIQLALLVVFVLAYSLAIYHRASPHIHARYMVCTALALIDPIVARLLYNHLGITPPLMQVMTYVLVDAIFLYLIFVDWKHGRRMIVFPAMLAVFIAAQVPTFIVPTQPFWHDFALWYGGLPIP